MSDVESLVRDLLRRGHLLSDIIMSGNYSKEVRVEALRLMRENVKGLRYST